MVRCAVAQRTRLWGFEAEEQRLLLDATTELPELRAIVERACPHPEIPRLLVLHASVKELNEMYDLVEALEDATRSRKKLDLLEGLRASLCTSIDGF